MITKIINSLFKYIHIKNNLYYSILSYFNLKN